MKRVDTNRFSLTQTPLFNDSTQVIRDEGGEITLDVFEMETVIYNTCLAVRKRDTSSLGSYKVKILAYMLNGDVQASGL